MRDDFSRLRGARVALDALAAIEAMAKSGPEQTWPEFWKQKRDAANFLVRASHAESPFLEGFVSTLAEYVLTIGSGIEPNISADAPRWVPIAAMTAIEFEDHRKEREAVE